jgi:hypothetical protein
MDDAPGRLEGAVTPCTLCEAVSVLGAKGAIGSTNFTTDATLDDRDNKQNSGWMMAVILVNSGTAIDFMAFADVMTQPLESGPPVHVDQQTSASVR